MMATQELVVPRSIPMTFPIFKTLSLGGLSSLGPEGTLAFVDEEAGGCPADQAVYRGRFWRLQRVDRWEMCQICNLFGLAVAWTGAKAHPIGRIRLLAMSDASAPAGRSPLSGKEFKHQANKEQRQRQIERIGQSGEMRRVVEKDIAAGLIDRMK